MGSVEGASRAAWGGRPTTPSNDEVSRFGSVVVKGPCVCYCELIDGGKKGEQERLVGNV